MEEYNSKDFKVFKDLGKLRVCTVSRVTAEGMETVDSNKKLAIEYNCGDNYVVISFVTPKTKIKGQVVGNRYKEYIVKNNLEDLYDEALLAAKFVFNPRYVQTPEETVKSIERFMKSL